MRSANVKPKARLQGLVDTQRIAIIGGGRAGSALEKGITRAKWPAHIAPKDAEGQRALVRESAIVILAIPFEARRDVADKLGDALEGKIVIDVTNPLTFPGPVYSFEGPGSGAEELQRWLPRARIVKGFNTVFSNAMGDARVGGSAQTSAFAASDDAAARELVLRLMRDMGFDAVDAGPLSNARSLEQLLFFEMMLEKIHGSRIGWRLLRAP